MELVTKAVNKDYKKADTNIMKEIIKEEKEIATDLEISDRVEKIVMKEAFGKLKDHKDGFNDDPKIRLLNPTKTEIGKMPK